MNARMLAAGLFLLSESGCGGTPPAAPTPVVAPRSAEPRTTAAEVLEQARKAYQARASYGDYGYVEVRGEDGVGDARLRFFTVFQRPEELVFAFGYQLMATENGRVPCFGYALHARASGDTLSWDSDRGEVRHASVRAAMAEIGGVAVGGSGLVPKLLLPNVLAGDSVLRIGGARMLQPERIEHLSYMRVAGTRQFGEEVVLYISDDLFLKRVSGPDYTVTYDYGNATGVLAEQAGRVDLERLGSSMCGNPSRDERG